jgi:hypothetical protein
MILSAQTACDGLLRRGLDIAQATAAGAFSDHGLLFHLEMLIDVFTLNAKLARGMAVWATEALENARSFSVVGTHGIS